MEIAVQLYGPLAALAGRQVTIDGPDDGWTIADLRRLIIRQYPDLIDSLAAPKARACVDDAIVAEDYRPAAGQGVEFLPPVSGG